MAFDHLLADRTDKMGVNVIREILKVEFIKLIGFNSIILMVFRFCSILAQNTKHQTLNPF